MCITVKNVGELKKALENFPDETPLQLQATGYDDECECDVAIDPAVDEMSLDLIEKRGVDSGKRVLEISNAKSEEMFYSP